jgi:hypothetical protein
MEKGVKMYKSYVEKAVKSVFSDAFVAQIEECEVANPSYEYYSSIDFIDDDDIIKVYFGFNRAILVELITAYMFEENPSEEIIKDFSGEMANLIVGKAKVFAQQDSHVVDIATPILMDTLPKDAPLDMGYNYNDQCFSVGI